MNAFSIQQQENSVTSRHMSGPVTFSLLFHGGLVAVGLVGLPFLHKPIPVISDPIPVEVVNVSEQATTNKPAARLDIEKAKVAPTKLDEPPKPVAPTQTAKEPPKPKAPTPPEPEPEKAKTETPPESELAPPKPAEKPKAPPKKPEKPMLTEEKPQPDTSSQDFEALLKNMIKDEAKPAPVPNTANIGTEASPNALQAAEMSRSELDAVRRQLEGCWKLLAGARFAEDQVVAVRIFVNPDRTVRDAQVVDQVRYMTDSFFRAAADAALRAVYNPACTPLELPPDKYDQWKDMIFNFDPRGML